MRLSEAPRRRKPILGLHLPVGRQGQHHLTGDPGILPALSGFRRVPQLASRAKPLRRTLGQKHLLVLGSVAVPELEHLRRTRGLGRLATAIGGGSHGAFARRTGDVAGTGNWMATVAL